MLCDTENFLNKNKMNSTEDVSDSFNMSEPLLVGTQVSLTAMMEPKFAILILAYFTGKYHIHIHM